MKIWQLECRQWIPCTPATVFPFFADAHNLELLTPPWLSFRIVTAGPIDIREGTLIDYRIGVHGVPIRWRTRIAAWEPPHSFADEQLRGPYALWHHTHTFTARDGGTELGDVVRLRPRGGPFAAVLMRAFVRRDVDRIFRHRMTVLAARFGGDAATAAARWSTTTA